MTYARLSTAAILLPALSFLLQSKVGLSLWDEGFLWYGAQRVLVGEVPIRDFMAYDIGRYYIYAFVMNLLGENGITSLRITNALVQALGIGLALYLMTRGSRPSDSLLVISIGLSSLLWMTPPFKAIDHVASLLLLLALSWILESPSPRRQFLCGVIIGIAAVIGRNHGLYGVVGYVTAMGYLWFVGTRSGFVAGCTAFCTGLVVGYSPMLSALVFVPGFWAAFIGDLRLLFEFGATNIAVPWPRPWWVRFEFNQLLDSLQGITIGVLFLIMPLFALGSLLYIAVKWRDRLPSHHPIFVASAFLILPYSHYAFSRADIVHLGLAIFPFMLAALCLPQLRTLDSRRTIGWIVLFTSLLVMVPEQPWISSTRDGDWVLTNAGGEPLTIDPVTAGDLALLDNMISRYAPPGTTFLAAPLWPGAYAVYRRKSPIWEIYALVPRSLAFQEREIGRLTTARPRFAVILDYPLDGRDALRFENTHPELDAFIRKTYRRVDFSGQSGRLAIYAQD